MLQFCIRLLVFCSSLKLASAQEGAGFPTASQASGYIELAFRYGPFAFAAFFAAGAWWMLRSARDAASSRGGSGPAQARLCRQFAVASGAACLAFAVVGTYYWMRFGSTHFYIGQINDLKTYEELASDNFFLRKELKADPLGETPLYYNLHFVVMQARPFWAGQRFEVAYYKKGSQARKLFEFAYDGRQGQRYRFEYDDQDRPVRLVGIPSTIQGDKKQAARFSLAAFAQVLPVTLMSPQPSKALQRGDPPVDRRLIGLLQDGRSDVGAKIDALDRLLSMNPSALKAYANTVVNGESFALTLIELSRHSDKELASKARQAAESSDAEGELARQLGSSNSGARKAAEQAMTRVSPDRAKRILSQAKASPGKEVVEAKLRTGATQVLSPVGSEGGDRYYVQAQWDPRDQKAVSCLTSVFNKELISNRTLQDEQKLMAGRNTRLVYWYTKDWALSMADKIRGCGAKATFPQPKR